MLIGKKYISKGNDSFKRRWVMVLNYNLFRYYSSSNIGYFFATNYLFKAEKIFLFPE